MVAPATSTELRMPGMCLNAGRGSPQKNRAIQGEVVNGDRLANKAES
jgi:hypothetical protein